MTEESENFDHSDVDVHDRCERKLDDALALLAVVAAHARMLERHENMIVGHGTELRRIRKTLESLEAAVNAAVSHQKEMNQLLSSIHSLWARLDCVRPRKDTPSSEVRAVGGGDLDGRD